jgi:hypothetical protein
MDTIDQKLKKLLEELEQVGKRQLTLARWSHWLNVSAMVLTLLTTGAAVAYGLYPGAQAKYTAGLALVPGGIALLASTLKFQQKCDWHYRRYNGLMALVRAIKFELPEQPTQEHITAISRAFGQLEVDMENMWEQNVSFKWTRFLKEEKD